MEKHGLNSQDVAKRVRIVHAGKRLVAPQSFEAVATATMARKRLKINHMNRQTGKTLEREISPQRLVHYRDNWYVDAWCHLRDDLRSFSVDAIAGIEVLETKAKEVAAMTIDESLGAGFGIFGGSPKAWAVLKFTPERARWVKGEHLASDKRLAMFFTPASLTDGLLQDLTAQGVDFGTQTFLDPACGGAAFLGPFVWHRPGRDLVRAVEALLAHGAPRGNSVFVLLGTLHGDGRGAQGPRSCRRSGRRGRRPSGWLALDAVHRPAMELGVALRLEPG